MASSRSLYVFSRVSNGGCCCYGGCSIESSVFVSLLEAKAALRAALQSHSWFHLEADVVYDKSYKGPPEKKTEIIEALYRGENVEEDFDFWRGVNSTDTFKNGHKMPTFCIGLPDTWEESWDLESGKGSVAITTTMDEENGDHGGHPRVDILSIVKVAAPMPV